MSHTKTKGMDLIEWPGFLTYKTPAYAFLKEQGYKVYGEQSPSGTTDGIVYWVGTKANPNGGINAGVVAFINSDEPEKTLLTKEALREMSAAARETRCKDVTLYTNFGMEIHSKYEDATTVGFDKIVKVIRPLDSFAKGGKIEMDDDIEVEENIEPDYENDSFITDIVRGGYDVSSSGKFIGHADSMEKAIEMLKDDEKGGNWFPTWWFVNERGSSWPIDHEGNEIKFELGGGLDLIQGNPSMPGGIDYRFDIHSPLFKRGGLVTGKGDDYHIKLKPYTYAGWNYPKQIVWVDMKYMHPDPLGKMIWGDGEKSGTVSDFKGFFSPAGPAVELELGKKRMETHNQLMQRRSELILDYITKEPEMEHGGMVKEKQSQVLDKEKIKELAIAFSKELRADISKKHMAEINWLNKRPEYSDGTCATHHFVDANEYMADAFKKVFNRDFIFFNDEEHGTEEQNEIDTYYWNNAWTLAKKNDFEVDKIEKADPDTFAHGGNIGRDRKFQSQQPWEQAYHRKRAPHHPHYHKMEQGGVATAENLDIYGYNTNHFDISPKLADGFRHAMEQIDLDKDEESAYYKAMQEHLRDFAKAVDVVLELEKKSVQQGQQLTEDDFNHLLEVMGQVAIFNDRAGNHINIQEAVAPHYASIIGTKNQPEEQEWAPHDGEFKDGGDLPGQTLEGYLATIRLPQITQLGISQQETDYISAIKAIQKHDELLAAWKKAVIKSVDGFLSRSFDKISMIEFVYKNIASKTAMWAQLKEDRHLELNPSQVDENHKQWLAKLLVSGIYGEFCLDNSSWNKYLPENMNKEIHQISTNRGKQKFATMLSNTGKYELGGGLDMIQGNPSMPGGIDYRFDIHSPLFKAGGEISSDVEEVKELILDAVKDLENVDQNSKDVLVTDANIKKILDAGYTKQEALEIFVGYQVGHKDKIKIDGEFNWTNGYADGIFSLREEYYDRTIDQFVNAAEKKQYEIGLKYPDFDWSDIVKKYKISKKAKIIKGPVKNWGGSESQYREYQVFQGKNVVVGAVTTRVRLENGKVKEKITEDYEPEVTDGQFNNGYWGIVSSSIVVINDIVRMIASKEDGYIKDMDIYVNGLGGVDALDLNEAVIAYKEGGTLAADSIPMTIMHQLGKGTLFMLGARNFVYSKEDPTWLSFRIRGSKRVNYIKITLTPMDTYKMEFGMIRQPNALKALSMTQEQYMAAAYKKVDEINDVYAEDLHTIIESQTGLYTKLFGKGGQTATGEDAISHYHEIAKAAKEQDIISNLSDISEAAEDGIIGKKFSFYHDEDQCNVNVYYEPASQTIVMTQNYDDESIPAGDDDISIDGFVDYLKEQPEPVYKQGGQVNENDGLRHALLEFVSAGTIANMTGLHKYKDIDGVRTQAIQMLNRDGDQPYSLDNLKALLIDAVDEWRENEGERKFAKNEYASGGKLKAGSVDADILHIYKHRDNLIAAALKKVTIPYKSAFGGFQFDIDDVFQETGPADLQYRNVGYGSVRFMGNINGKVPTQGLYYKNKSIKHEIEGLITSLTQIEDDTRETIEYVEKQKGKPRTQHAILSAMAKNNFSKGGKINAAEVNSDALEIVKSMLYTMETAALESRRNADGFHDLPPKHQSALVDIFYNEGIPDKGQEYYGEVQDAVNSILFFNKIIGPDAISYINPRMQILPVGYVDIDTARFPYGEQQLYLRRFLYDRSRRAESIAKLKEYADSYANHKPKDDLLFGKPYSHYAKAYQDAIDFINDYYRGRSAVIESSGKGDHKTYQLTDAENFDIINSMFFSSEKEAKKYADEKGIIIVEKFAAGGPIKDDKYLIRQMHKADSFELGTPAIYTDENGQEYSGEIVMNSEPYQHENGATSAPGNVKGISLYKDKNYSGSAYRFIVPHDWFNVKTFYEAHKQEAGGKVKSIKKEDIAEGARFKLSNGTVFIIDKVAPHKTFGVVVESSIEGGAKGNYKDSIEDTVSFFNEEGAVKIMKAGGRVGFTDKVKAIAASLKGVPVPKKYKKDYGKTYNGREAVEAAKRIAGAMAKKRKVKK